MDWSWRRYIYIVACGGAPVLASTSEEGRGTKVVGLAGDRVVAHGTSRAATARLFAAGARVEVRVLARRIVAASFTCHSARKELGGLTVVVGGTVAMHSAVTKGGLITGAVLNALDIGLVNLCVPAGIMAVDVTVGNTGSITRSIAVFASDKFLACRTLLRAEMALHH